MNSREYQSATRRTDLEDYTFAMERIETNKQTIHQALILFMLSSGTLDLMKKRVVYNAGPEKLRELDAEHVETGKLFTNDEYLTKIAKDEKLSKLFHYVIGIITEANEMVSALVQGANGSLDDVNMGEENSDIFWYQARIADLLGQDMDTQRQMNIDKLKVRFPNKFTEESANIRDLQAERKILEGTPNTLELD